MGRTRATRHVCVCVCVCHTQMEFWDSEDYFELLTEHAIRGLMLLGAPHPQDLLTEDRSRTLLAKLLCCWGSGHSEPSGWQVRDRMACTRPRIRSKLPPAPCSMQLARQPAGPRSPACTIPALPYFMHALLQRYPSQKRRIARRVADRPTSLHAWAHVLMSVCVHVCVLVCVNLHRRASCSKTKRSQRSVTSYSC